VELSIYQTKEVPNVFRVSYLIVVIEICIIVQKYTVFFCHVLSSVTICHFKFFLPLTYTLTHSLIIPSQREFHEIFLGPLELRKRSINRSNWSLVSPFNTYFSPVCFASFQEKVHPPPPPEHAPQGYSRKIYGSGYLIIIGKNNLRGLFYRSFGTRPLGSIGLGTQGSEYSTYLAAFSIKKRHSIGREK
jgi:hypothetical protein